MSIPTPNYVTTEEIIYQNGRGGFDNLPAGTFARPIEFTYVPKHVIEDSKWSHYREDRHWFCYTSRGFMLVEKTKLRKV